LSQDQDQPKNGKILIRSIFFFIQPPKGDRSLQATEEFGIVRQHDKYFFKDKPLVLLSTL